MIVPGNLYQTISSEEFVTYMGIGSCDMRIDIQQTEDMMVKGAEILAYMEEDSVWGNKVMLTTKTYMVLMDDGSKQYIRVELGDHTVFPITYYKGVAPITEDEIALSVLLADELDTDMGDCLVVLIEGEERELTISGLYSDVTNGGKTAKATFVDESADVMWSVISAELDNRSLLDNKVQEYSSKFEYAKVSGIDAYVRQLFGTTMDAMKLASVVAMLIAVLIVCLVTLLFIKMLVVRDRYSISVLKALGYTNGDIIKQYLSRSACIAVASAIIGIFLANTVGEWLAGALISSLGTASFQFISNPAYVYLLCPVMLIVAVFVSTIIGTHSIRNIKIQAYIKE